MSQSTEQLRKQAQYLDSNSSSSYPCVYTDTNSLNEIEDFAAFCVQQSNNDFRTRGKRDDCIYSSSASDKNKPVQEADKDELIKQATNRLRQKVLENKLKSFMSSLVEIKSQLEIIKMETSISLQLLPTSSDTIMSETQLRHFEQRFVNHVENLKSLLPQKEVKISNLIQTMDSSSSPISPSSSMIYSQDIHSSCSSVICTSTNSSSATSILHRNIRNSSNETKTHKNIVSHISSVFAPCSHHEIETNSAMESDYAILGEYDHQKRVSKRKKLYQHQNHFLNYNILSAQLSHTASPTPSICHDSLLKPSDPTNDSISISQHLLQQPSRQCDTKSIYSRNEFDDVLSYINNNADDMDFRDDLSELLASPLFLQNNDDLTLMHQPLTKNKGIFESLVLTGVKYIRFTIVMLLAILINLKRGKPSLGSAYKLKHPRHFPVIVH